PSPPPAPTLFPYTTLFRSPVVRDASAALVGALLASGLWIIGFRQAFLAADEEVPVMEFVRESLQPGDLYYVPVSVPGLVKETRGDRKSTRLNSSHEWISYA